MIEDLFHLEQLDDLIWPPLTSIFAQNLLFFMP